MIIYAYLSCTVYDISARISKQAGSAPSIDT